MIYHITPDGWEHPIAFGSRTLLCAKQNFSSGEGGVVTDLWYQEVSCVSYGRNFILEIDHKSLIAIFGSKKGIPMMGAACCSDGLYNYQHTTNRSIFIQCKSMQMLMIFHGFNWMKGIWKFTMLNQEFSMCLSWTVYLSPPLN